MFLSAVVSAGVNIGLNFAFLRMELWPGESGSVFAVGLATLIATASTLALVASVAHRRFGVRERRFETANVQFYQSLRAGLFAVCAMTACAYLARRPLLDVLVPDVSVRDDCLPLFAWALLLEPFRAINIIGTASLRSTGDVRYSCVIAMLLTWGLGVPACYALGINLGYGLSGIWMGMVIDEGTRAAANLARWRTGRWREHRLVVDASLPA